MTALVYLEQTDGAVDEPSLQAATLATSLAGGAEVHAVVAGATPSLAPAGPLPVEIGRASCRERVYGPV